MVQKSNRGSKPSPHAARRLLRRRGAILEAAAGVFRDRGVAATGMRDIADAAELSPGNLYYYFRNKAELLYFCQLQALERMLAAATALESGPQPAASRLKQLIAAHLEITLNEVDGAAAHTEVQELPAPLRRRIVARRDRYERAIRRIVQSGVRKGEFKSCDVVLVTRAILGALNWTTRWFRPDGSQSYTDVAECFADYLVRGLEK